MDEIKNSAFRERYRKEEEARIWKKIEELNRKHQEEYNHLAQQLNFQTKELGESARQNAKAGFIGMCLIGGPIALGVIGLIAYGTVNIPFVVVWGLILGGIVYAVKSKSIGQNEEIAARQEGEANKERQLEQLNKKHQKQLEKLREEADRNTANLIKDYENKVDKCAQQWMMQESKLAGIIDWQLRMMDKAISRIPRGSQMKFIETALTFEVNETKISYFLYSDTHSNASDDCVFSMYGLPNMKTDVEKEGFAQAITKLTMLHIVQRKKANTVKMRVGHQDARVRIEYKEMLF